MQIFYSIKLSIEIDEAELGGEKPKDFIEKRLEEDPAWLLEDSVILGHTVSKVVKEEVPEDDDYEDDDGLTELSEEELEF